MALQEINDIVTIADITNELVVDNTIIRSRTLDAYTINYNLELVKTEGDEFVLLSVEPGTELYGRTSSGAYVIQMK